MNRKEKFHTGKIAILRLAAFLLLFLAFVKASLFCSCAAKELFRADYQGGSVTMQVSFPNWQEENGNTVRAGRDFGLIVTISAEDVFLAGEINVLMLNEQENHLSFSKELSVAEGESREIIFLLPMNQKTLGLRLTLTGEDGEAVLEEVLPLNVVNYGKYLLIGVCEADLSRYGYLKAFGNRLISLREEDFSYEEESLNALDVIVAEEGWLGRLEDKDAACLQEWIRQGGLLVIGSLPQEGQEMATLNLGLQEQTVLQNLISAISDYETERNGILSANEEIRKQALGPECYVGDSILGSVLVNSLSDEMVRLPVEKQSEEPEGEFVWQNMAGTDVEIAWKEGKREIILKCSFGRGTVLRFLIPLGTESRDIYPLFYYRIVWMLMENRSLYSTNRSYSEMYGSDWGSYSYLLSFFEEDGERIRVGPYFAVLALYIGVLLPTVFLLLRRYGKSKYVWGALPAFSLLKVLLIYAMGSGTRIRKPYCTYLNIVDYTEKEGRGLLEFTLSAPTNRGAELTLMKKASVKLGGAFFIPHNPTLYSRKVQRENILKAKEYRASVTISEDQVKLELKNVAAFSGTSFQVAYEAEKLGDFKSDINVSCELMNGSISNQTGVDFQSVYLYGNNVILGIDSMEAWETAELVECRQVYFSSQEDWYNEELLAQVFNRDPLFGENRAVLNLIFDYVNERNREGNYIFALPAEDSNVNPLGEVAGNPHSQGVEVLIYPFEIKEAQQKEDAAEEKEESRVEILETEERFEQNEVAGQERRE